MINQPFQAFQQVKVYYPFVGPFDPCPPIKEKTYMTPPNLYMMFQPPNLPQFSPFDALKHGTLWPALVSPYGGKNAKFGKK